MRAVDACVDIPDLGRPDTGPGRIPITTTAQLLLSTLAAQATLLTLSPLLPEVARDLGVTTSAAGQLRAISGLVAGIAALVLTVRPPQTSLRRVLLSGLVMLSVGAAASAAAPTFLLLAAAQIPIGIGLAYTLGGALAASDRWAPPGRKAQLLSSALIGQPLAWVFGMPLVGIVGQHGWRFAWSVPLLATIPAAVMLSRRRDTETCEPPLPLSIVRDDRRLRTWLLGELLALSAWAGTLIYIGALFIESYDVSVSSAGFILGGVAIAYLPGNAIFRRHVDASALRLLVALALALAALSVPFGAWRPSVAVSFALVAAIAFFAGGRTIAGSARGLAVGGDRKLGVMSLRTAALQFGYLLGGGIGGLALSAGGYVAVGITFAVLFVASALVHGGMAGAHPEIDSRATDASYSDVPSNAAS